MAKAVKPLMIVAAIAVNVIPGVGQVLSAWGLSAVMSASLITAVTTAGIGAALGMAAGALGLGPKAPKIPSATYDRLNANADVTTPRKIIFGNTAMSVDIRHQEWSTAAGNNQGLLHRVFFHASHKVHSIDEIWFEDRKAWTKSGGVQSFYIDSSGSHTGPYLTVTTREEGSGANTITINGGVKWGSSRRCTGLAYSYLSFRMVGNNPKEPTNSPFSSGVPSRMTVRGRGAPVYDPRLDTTVGGSGSHRANDQTTWEYNNAIAGDIGRNPALQILWYLLGWRINGKLALGRGIPASRINMASFIAAANACDETVTSSVNGSEPRYRSDCAFSENDDPNTVLDVLKTACGGDVRDFGGILSLHIRKNDLATVSVQLSEADILGGFVWKQTPDIDETFNEVRGRFVDPSDASLYQLRDYPAVRVEPVDGIERAEPFDLVAVQSISQCQRLAKGRLARNFYRGTFAADFNARAWATGVGKIVELSVGPLGWTNKKFRVLEMGIRVDGVVPMLLQEEHSDVYLWDNSDVAGIQPLVPTSYDPSLAPDRVLLDTIQPGATRNVWRGNWAAAVAYGTGDLVMGSDGTVYEALVDHTSVAGQPPPNANWTNWFATSGDSLSATITKPAHTVSASSDGIVTDYTGAGGKWQIMAGTTDVTSQFTLTTVANPVTLDTSYVGADYAVTGSFDAAADTADLTMRMTGTGSFVGITFDRTFTLTKIRAPAALDTTPPALPTGLALSSTTAIQPDGTQQSTLIATWTANVESDLAYYILSVRNVGGNFVDYVVGGTRWSASVIAGQQFEAQLRAVDKSGNKSTATAITAAHTVGGDTTAPALPTGLTASASFQNVFLNWTSPSDADLVAVEVWEHTSNASGSATRIATVGAEAGKPGTFVRPLATGQTRFYWLKSVDLSGNASGFTTSVTATTATMDAGTQVTPGSITTALITVNTLNGDRIQAGTITASKLTVVGNANDQLPTGILIGTTGTTIGTVNTNASTALSTANTANAAAGTAQSTANTASAEATRGRAGNLMPNSDLAQNDLGWAYFGTLAAGNYGRDFAGDTWRPVPEHTVGMRTLLPAAGASYMISPYVAVKPNDWVEIQAMAAAHRCRGAIRIQFVDAAISSELGTVGTGYQTLGTGGPTLGTNSNGNGWTPLYVKGQAPANTAYARIIVDKEATTAGQPDSYLWLTRPYLGFANANQTTASPFSHTGSTVNDPVALANTKTTLLAPGLVLISGATTLASWRNGGDNTKIEGGAIAANTINANKLTIGNRGINFMGINFQYINSGNYLHWSGGGYIFYTDDSGGQVALQISTGTYTWPGTYGYIYWTKGSNVLTATTDWASARANPDNVLLCTWYGGSNFNANFGGTIVHGDNISTGTINADRIIAGTITASRFLTDQGVDLGAIISGALNTGKVAAQAGSSSLVLQLNTPSPAQEAILCQTAGLRVNNDTETIFVSASVNVTASSNRGGVHLQVYSTTTGVWSTVGKLGANVQGSGSGIRTWPTVPGSSYEHGSPLAGEDLYWRLRQEQTASQGTGDGTAGTSFTVQDGKISVRRMFSK